MMLSKRFIGFVIIEYVLLVFVTNAYSVKRSESARNLLSRLLSPKREKKPLVLIVDFARNAKTTSLDKVLDFDERKPVDYDYLGNDNDWQRSEEISPIFNLINPAPYYSGTSSSSSEEIVRNALRTALRCRQVDNCVKKCPPKKPNCPMNCQQVFDNLNLCDTPTTTRNPCGKKPRCGKTMPPKWRI